MFKSDYKEKNNKEENIVVKYLGLRGRMIGGSKSIYLYDNPKNVVLFNSNIFTKKEKIWYGDLDLTKDLETLKKLSLELKEPFYILYETDGRFIDESKVDLSKAQFIFDNGELIIKNDYCKLVRNKLQLKPIKQHKEKLNVKYDQDEFIETFELPNLKKLKAKPKYSMLEQFQKALIELHGKQRLEEVYLSMYVHPEYYDELEKIIEKHLNKSFPNLHPVKIEQNISMEMLDAPLKFYSKQKWIKKNLGYIRKRSS